MIGQRHQRNYVIARSDVHNANTTASTSDLSMVGHSDSSSSQLTDNHTLPTPFEQGHDMVQRRFIEVSGPIPFGGSEGFQGRAVCLTLGTFDCSHPSNDPNRWVGHRHADPERSLVPIDDQHLDYHLKNYPDIIDSVRCQAMMIHQLVDHYMNGDLSIYPSARSLETLDLILDFIQPEVNKLLELVTNSVALVCCYVTFFDPVNKDSKRMLEHITVEYFCSPWTKKWNRRVKRDVVNEK
ncbi:hypothetical protein BG015_000600 [Linnemannia schmuckeri]|uniref:Uncharacterized protein n=1 Tax=Linnemannia schmuckeri TaxID=64567 RepID=A0A9P5RT97_9FUNG|nr:hypothetical protein BG015_000600 [Linnemannia schmuckeri]